MTNKDVARRLKTVRGETIKITDNIRFIKGRKDKFIQILQNNEIVAGIYVMDTYDLHLYTFEKFRGQGIWSKNLEIIIDFLEKYFEDGLEVSFIKPFLIPLFERCGFKYKENQTYDPRCGRLYEKEYKGS